MVTLRLSCGSGGKAKGNKTKDDDAAEETADTPTVSEDRSVNIQQLPSDEETRAAFIPEDGYVLIDPDYGDLQKWIILITCD